ncbi:hypothetical protein LKO27_13585 [Tessaracoccus sp. OS52]|uniref:hypothetical protein n=1 Tax=Tessaracoccus sp. OS52 TaxID=2886691 RepID=UPI001D125906|nr:hypothetical protein [Tessaracoccus sp. OS52]MCC2594436.1 hypothetical protein [Tessaracoccus sp. OS52]
METHGAIDAAALLSGPRGRRLCLELARRSLGDDVAHAIFYASHRMDPGAGTSRVLFGFGNTQAPEVSADAVAAAIAAAGVPEIGDEELWAALTDAVANARYWQEPDGEDVLAVNDDVRRALGPLAAAVADSPHARWWTTPFDADGQALLDWDGPGQPASSGHPAAVLDAWRRDQVAGEERAAKDRPADPTADHSGEWWSIPPHGLFRTTRSLPGRGPAGFWLVEDETGWTRALVTAVEVPDGVRVLELDSPDAWADLCRRHPLRVTASKRHDWYRTTGRGDVEWVVPDWAAVAREADVVHLSVAGWLTTAGVAVEVADGVASVLAGWDPDAAFWLTSHPTPKGPALSDRPHWIERPA